jgi:hypothetical protein
LGLTKGSPPEWELCVECLTTVVERCGYMREALWALLAILNDRATGPLLQCTLLDAVEIILLRWSLPASERRRRDIRELGRGLQRCFAAKELDVRSRAERNFAHFQTKYPGMGARIFDSLPLRVQKRMRPQSDAAERAASADVAAAGDDAAWAIGVAASYMNGLNVISIEAVESSSEEEVAEAAPANDGEVDGEVDDLDDFFLNMSDDYDGRGGGGGTRSSGASTKSLPRPTHHRRQSDLGRADLLHSPGMESVADSLGMAELYKSVSQLDEAAHAAHSEMRSQATQSQKRRRADAEEKRAKRKKERALRRAFEKRAREQQRRAVTLTPLRERGAPFRRSSGRRGRRSVGAQGVDVVVVADHRTQTRAAVVTLKDGIERGLVDSLGARAADSPAPPQRATDAAFGAEIDRRFEAFTKISQRFKNRELTITAFAVMYVEIFGSSAESLAPELLTLMGGTTASESVVKLEHAIASALVDRASGAPAKALRHGAAAPLRVRSVRDDGDGDCADDFDGGIDDLDLLAEQVRCSFFCLHRYSFVCSFLFLFLGVVTQLGAAFRAADEAARSPPPAAKASVEAEAADAEADDGLLPPGAPRLLTVEEAALALDRRLAETELALRPPSPPATERYTGDGLGHVDPRARATLELNAAVEKEEASDRAVHIRRISPSARRKLQQFASENRPSGNNGSVRRYVLSFFSFSLVFPVRFNTRAQAHSHSFSLFFSQRLDAKPVGVAPAARRGAESRRPRA